KRFGSPLALTITPSHCGFRRVSVRSRSVSCPRRNSGLSPPPIRRASPPASTSPSVGGTSIVMHRGLAAVLGALFLDIGEVLVEHDAVEAGERNKAFSARAPDQGQV